MATRMRAALLVGLLILAAPLLPVVAVAPATGAYRYSADDCAYMYWLVPTVAAEAWRARVPERFAIVGEETGAVVAVVTFVECTFTVNGGEPHLATIGDVGVTIVPPTGTLGTLDFFHLWQVTNSPVIAELNAAWGIPSELAAPAHVAGEPFFVAPTLAVGWGSVLSSFSTYGATAFHSPPHEASPGTAVWWRETDGGLLRIEQSFLPGLLEGDGVGDVWVADGPLRELIPPSNIRYTGYAPSVTSVSYTDLMGGAAIVPE